MTTQRDLETAADAKTLEICSKCGWYVMHDHHQPDRCDPVLGQVAQRLIEAAPDIRSGQLGYGAGHVIFDLSERDFSIVFQVHKRSDARRNHPLSFQAMHLFDDLSVDEAAALVRALKKWQDETLASRPTWKSADRKIGE